MDYFQRQQEKQNKEQQAILKQAQALDRATVEKALGHLTQKKTAIDSEIDKMSLGFSRDMYVNNSGIMTINFQVDLAKKILAEMDKLGK